MKTSDFIVVFFFIHGRLDAFVIVFIIVIRFFLSSLFVREKELRQFFFCQARWSYYFVYNEQNERRMFGVCCFVLFLALCSVHNNNICYLVRSVFLLLIFVWQNVTITLAPLGVYSLLCYLLISQYFSLCAFFSHSLSHSAIVGICVKFYCMPPYPPLDTSYTPTNHPKHNLANNYCSSSCFSIVLYSFCRHSMLIPSNKVRF